MESISAQRLIAVVEHFRQLNPQIPLQTVATFLLVAEEPGITFSKLREKLNVSLSSVSRNVYTLSDLGKPGRDGYGLVEIGVNPANRREKTALLSARGYQFYRELVRRWQDT